MKRIVLFLLFSILNFQFLISPAFAEGEFSTSISTRYTIYTDGKTTVSHTITLTNLFSTIHAVSYSFVIQGTIPKNIKTTEDGKEIPTTVTEEEQQTRIIVNFPTPVVGKGKSRIFTIGYEDEKVAIKNGQVWDITIPKIAEVDKYEETSVLLLVPKNFGEPAYISPKTPHKSIESNFNVYRFTKEQLKTSSIVAAFGTFQVFGFELSYHLKNPLKTTGITEIALPPDTAFQRIFYNSIIPQPISVRIDEDGNWLAEYRLRVGETVDVRVTGAVQLFATAQELFIKTTPDLSNYLKPTEFWPSDNPQILGLAKKLSTPQEIYNFVVKTLSYDYSKVKEGVERLGAIGTLANPQNAICMEFTDLFIALSRAAGIPAREINGYAYTENLKIQPLSLVADVLHAWPEYWDSERSLWIPVDPTWGNTTGGVDYFNKLDLAHFAFVIHGKNSEQPFPAGSYKLADNPQKDVVVFFGTLPAKKEEVNLSIKLNRQIFPFLSFSGQVIIKNIGPTAFYDLEPKISSTNGKVNLDQQKINFILPFTTQTLAFSWQPTSLFPKQGTITVLAAGSRTSYNIGAEILIWQILSIFLLLTIITLVVLTLIFILRRLRKVNGFNKITKWSWRLPFQR